MSVLSVAYTQCRVATRECVMVLLTQRKVTVTHPLPCHRLRVSTDIRRPLISSPPQHTDAAADVASYFGIKLTICPFTGGRFAPGTILLPSSPVRSQTMRGAVKMSRRKKSSLGRRNQSLYL
ncbi:hypothetical protein BaRGS_00039383 [Batillaria attramentaria]|uniref:Uncharacterized protein n=1 Tax=Batillaria attramentaria TaxID=370345 RepID=A0ABD0J480_9CAEN